MGRKARRMSQWPQVETVDSTVRDCLSCVRIDGRCPATNKSGTWLHWLLVLAPIRLPLNRAVIDREGIVRRSAEDKKKPCKNCEGKGTLKKGDKIVRCQRCGGTGIKPS
jgi:hypothetical protein